MDRDVRLNLKAVIRDKGYIQEVIAQKAGITPMKLSMVLNQKRKLDANEMIAICDAIEMTPTELAEYEPRLPEGSKEQSELPDGRGREVRKSGGSENNSG